MLSLNEMGPSHIASTIGINKLMSFRFISRFSTIENIPYVRYVRSFNAHGLLECTGDQWALTGDSCAKSGFSRKLW